jgi:glycosyltransferase involved in cell wall biosynthesis
MRKVIHIVRMWPSAHDPQHGSFVVAHLRALAPHVEQRVVVWDGQPEAQHLFAEEFDVHAPSAGGFSAKWRLLKRLLDADQPHVVHVHGGGKDSALAFLLIHMLHGSRVKRVVTEHQSQWADQPNPGAIWTLRLAHARTAVSGWLADLIKTHSAGAEVAVVPNCLTAPKLPLERSESTHRRFLWVGDLTPLKGLQQVLEAWTEHHKGHPSDTLTLVGGTETAGLHSDHVPEGATYAGPATPEEVHQRMLHHDILVVNSERETFGMVIGEALERGMRVLCTPIPGPQSVYQEAGITYRKDHSLEDLIAHLARSEKWSDAPAQLERFRGPRVAEAFLALYTPTRKKGN